ncbi:hypothetical protein BIU96_04985 [Curtobacterium sp. MCBA15_008]|nr:hypothetical protein BIU96_04985 [Curtobacterium sp. MCBA15_008]
MVETIFTGADLRTMNGLHPTPDAAIADILSAAGALEDGKKWSIMSVESATTEAIRDAAASFDAVADTTTTYVRPLAAADVVQFGTEFDIREVASREAANDFEVVLGDAFGAGRSLGAPFVDEAVLASVGARAIVAYRRGVPVATGMSILDDLGFLGIFAIGVSPKVQRQGLGAAVTAQLLKEGQRDGAHTAYLQSSAAGLSVYRRLGFAAAADGITYFFPSDGK